MVRQEMADGATSLSKERPSFVEPKIMSGLTPLPRRIQTSDPKALKSMPPAALNLPLSGAGSSTHDENQFVDRYSR
jgi:hypothetical protein